MRMFVPTLVGIFLASQGSLCAQEEFTARKGKNLPDITVTHILNYGDSTLKLSSLRGKIVILDFWSRGCGSCIAAFPKVEEFNATYEDRVIILPVTKDSYEDFKKLKLRSQILKESSLPFILNDKVLHEAYPHYFVPYCVWFNEDGEFIATSNRISKKMIDSVLSSGKLESSAITFWIRPEAESFNTVKNRLNRRIWNGKEYFSSIRKQKYSELERSKSVYYNLTDSSAKTQIGYGVNGRPLITFIASSYNLRACDVVLESEDLLYLLPPKDRDSVDEWNKTNLYVFEHAVAPENYSTYRDYFNEFYRQDIYNQFGIVGETTEIVRPCYVLRRKDTTNATPIISKSPDDLAKTEITKNGLLLLNSCNMHDLVSTLTLIQRKNTAKEYPIFDETNVLYKVDLSLKVDFNNQKELEKEFSKYGLELKLEHRPLKSLVLKKIKKSSDLSRSR